MDAFVHLLTSVATLRYSRSAFFTLTQLESHPFARSSRNEACLAAQSGTIFSSDKRQPIYFMADIANKYSENAAGKLFVDNQCIDCDLCRETAPDNFKRNDDGGYSYVYKQAESPEEEARCKEAKEGCPVEAIGDNG